MEEIDLTCRLFVCFQLMVGNLVFPSELPRPVTLRTRILGQVQELSLALHTSKFELTGNNVHQLRPAKDTGDAKIPPYLKLDIGSPGFSQDSFLL